jgi:hypothetical protein
MFRSVDVSTVTRRSCHWECRTGFAAVAEKGSSGRRSLQGGVPGGQNVIHGRRAIWIGAVGLAATALTAHVVAANAHAGSPPLDTIIGYTVMAAAVAGFGLLLAAGARLLVVFVGDLSELPDKTALALGRVLFVFVLLPTLVLCVVLLTLAWEP